MNTIKKVNSFNNRLSYSYVMSEELEKEKEELERQEKEIIQEIEQIKGVDSTGFSLDPTYDYDSLRKILGTY